MQSSAPETSVWRIPKEGRRAGWRLVLCSLTAALLSSSAAVADVHRSDDGFAAAMGSAMSRMMANMNAKPTGDADRDFVAMMVPHHQGAVDMAVAELRFGKDETLKRIAQEIIVEQRQEIEAMKSAISQTSPQPAPARTARPHRHEELSER
jgi:hypothetical protein